MDTTVIVLIVLVVLLLLALGAAGVMLSRRRRSERLQEHYGSEYERSVRETGDRRAAEAELTTRERRHAELDIRDLRPEERERYRASWSDIQQGFVDDPVRSVHAADRLVTDIMRTRGYPVDDFDRRAEDISVAHPDVVEHYREARSVREATDDGSQVDADQQRRAVTSYRSLVEALLGSDATMTGGHDDRGHDDRPRRPGPRRRARENRHQDDRRVDDDRVDDRRYDDRNADPERTDGRRTADDHRYSRRPPCRPTRRRARPGRPPHRGAHSMSTSEQHDTDVSRRDRWPRARIPRTTATRDEQRPSTRSSTRGPDAGPHRGAARHRSTTDAC